MRNNGQFIKSKLKLTAKNENMRLDQYLKQNIEGISRTYAQYLIKSGNVTAKNPYIDSAIIVKPGDVYYVDIPDPNTTSIIPFQEKLNILFEDEYLIILNKRAGMTVHPGASTQNDTLVNALVAHCGDNLSNIGMDDMRPGIVHRLDKDTSGLMMVAKNNLSHHKLRALISEQKITRKYLTVIWGIPKSNTGVINIPIGRHPKNNKTMCINKHKGKEAITHYKLIKTINDGATSLLECQLKTGRTHQIRVHLNYIGHSVIGDQTYGKRTRKSKIAFTRQALHSHYLALEHPINKTFLEFNTEIPSDMQNLISSLENNTCAYRV